MSSSHIDVAGASGAVYRFNLAENARPQTAVAGVFLYVSQTDGVPPALLYIGHGDMLASTAISRWDEAVKSFGATHLYIRLNVARATREAEMADLLAVYSAPMNAVPGVQGGN